MSNKVEIKVNYSEVGALLRGSETQQMLKTIASRISQRCGSGYMTTTKRLGTRVIGSVYTVTKEAMKDNLQNNTLLKGLRG